MKVSELKNILEQYDKDCEIEVYDYEYNDIYKIENIKFLDNKLVIYYE